MNTLFSTLPSPEEMHRAFTNRDAAYEGIFVVAVKTTGIFCRPTCPARRPNRENVTFFANVRDALAAGYRPCKRCEPIKPLGEQPAWLARLFDAVEGDPSHRWTDQELRNLEVDPTRVRRWFKQHHGITFHSYLRTRRLALAIGQIQSGENLCSAAFANGYESVSGLKDGLKKWLGDAKLSQFTGPPILVSRLLTPLGPMVAAADDEGLSLLEFADRRMLRVQFQRIARYYKQPIAPGEHPLLQAVKTQLEEYFAGTRTAFGLPLRDDGSDFQQTVWQALREIPYGQTRSYEQLAAKIGKEKAARAVGRANGDNRFAIIIPCHRVLRSDGSLSGYGGGVWRKHWLLQHERKHLCVT